MAPPPPLGQQGDAMVVDAPSGWVQLFARKEFQAGFFVGGEAAVANKFGPANPEGRKQGDGLWNSNLGRDKVKGDFCVLSLQTACELVSLIVRHSYVRFGQQVLTQACTLPTSTYM